MAYCCPPRRGEPDLEIANHDGGIPRGQPASDTLAPSDGDAVVRADRLADKGGYNLRVVGFRGPGA